MQLQVWLIILMPNECEGLVNFQFQDTLNVCSNSCTMSARCKSLHPDRKVGFGADFRYNPETRQCGQDGE